MQINGTTKTCGLIGCPVEHTLSPIIHNTLAEHMGQNLVYVPLHVEKEHVKEAIEGAHALSLWGMNVTVPHKSAVMPYLKEIDPLAEKIGAVNTLVTVEGGYKGYNTDITGLQRAIESEGITIEGRDAILLGAGGAARAVAFMLVYKGARTVYMLNRSVEKAEAVAKEVNQVMECDIVKPMALTDYKKLPPHKYLCIQGTSVGLYPKADAAVIEEKEFYDLIDVGVDLIYKPAKTKFMQLCEQSGVKAYNGLKMLLYQGIISYELWNDVQVDHLLAEKIYELLKEATKVEA